MAITKKVILDTLAPFYTGDEIKHHHWKALWNLYEEVLATYNDNASPFTGLPLVGKSPVYQAAMWYLDSLPEESVVDVSVYTDTGMVSLSVPVMEIRRLKDSNNAEIFTTNYKARLNEEQDEQAKEDRKRPSNAESATQNGLGSTPRNPMPPE